MAINKYVEKIHDHWKSTGLPVVPKTSVISPMYPGKLCHCLDERDILEKYGSLIDVGFEHYQKLQPAIRMDDYAQEVKEGGAHLGHFNIATINGFHIINRSESRVFYEKSVKGLLSFFEDLNLEKSRLVITYFAGNNAKDIESSRKEGSQKRRIEFDKYIPEDPLVNILHGHGLRGKQLFPVVTRDNFLTSAWYATEAPWGYRNEIHYLLPNGKLLDIATIERLEYVPVFEDNLLKGLHEKAVVGLEDWSKCMVIDGCGLERIMQAREGAPSIFDIGEYKAFRDTGQDALKIEAAKICHRVYSDSSFSELSLHRKRAVKKAMRDLDSLPISDVEELLKANAEIYAPIHPELGENISKTIQEIEDYRERRK